MKLVYIAGAFRGPTAWDVAENVRAAERAGFEVAKLGGFPIIPHANGANFDGTFTAEFWLEGTLELMRRCDAVYVFNREHLTTSEGTRGEFRTAIRMGLPVFHDLLDLRLWLDGDDADGAA